MMQILIWSGGSRPYHRKRASRHSCAPSYVPFTVNGCTFSHAPVFVSRHKGCAYWTGSPARVHQVLLYPQDAPFPHFLSSPM